MRLIGQLCTRCRQLFAAGRCAGLSTQRPPPPPPNSVWGSRKQPPPPRTASDPGASALLYICSASIFMLGVAYVSVPLYRMFCRLTGTASNPLEARVESSERVRRLQPVPDRQLIVTFSADTHSQLAWNFRPQQPRVHLVPGETVLIFYTAKNPTDAPVTGIATYTVVPNAAAQYFHKIQCFCFEEQRLNPGEEVDMPVFFYIDPEFGSDPRLRDVRQITLSYCFFQAKEGLNLPLPGFPSVGAAA